MKKQPEEDEAEECMIRRPHLAKVELEEEEQGDEPGEEEEHNKKAMTLEERKLF